MVMLPIHFDFTVIYIIYFICYLRLYFADEIVILAEDIGSLQRSTERLSQEAGNIGLRISSKKSKDMHVGGMYV